MQINKGKMIERYQSGIKLAETTIEWHRDIIARIQNTDDADVTQAFDAAIKSELTMKIIDEMHKIKALGE